MSVALVGRSPTGRLPCMMLSQGSQHSMAAWQHGKDERSFSWQSDVMILGSLTAWATCVKSVLILLGPELSNCCCLSAEHGSCGGSNPRYHFRTGYLSGLVPLPPLLLHTEDAHPPTWFSGQLKAQRRCQRGSLLLAVPDGAAAGEAHRIAAVADLRKQAAIATAMCV